MGFTIDMVSGNISNITNGIDSEKTETASPIMQPENTESLLPQERLLPVSDTYNKPDFVIPSALINQDVELFIEDVSR